VRRRATEICVVFRKGAKALLSLLEAVIDLIVGANFLFVARRQK